MANKYQAFYAGKIALWCYLIPEWDISASPWPLALPARRGRLGKAFSMPRSKSILRVPHGPVWQSPSSPPPQIRRQPTPSPLMGPSIASRYLPSLPYLGGRTGCQCIVQGWSGRAGGPVLWMRTTRTLPRSRSPIPETATRDLQGALPRGQRSGPDRQPSALPLRRCVSVRSILCALPRG